MARDDTQTPSEQPSEADEKKWNVAAGAGIGGLFAPFAGLGAWVMDLELFGVVGVAVLAGAALGTFIASPST